MADGGSPLSRVFDEFRDFFSDFSIFPWRIGASVLSWDYFGQLYQLTVTDFVCEKKKCIPSWSGIVHLIL